MSYRDGKNTSTTTQDFPIEPFAHNKEAVRLFLDRAVIRMEQGDPAGSLSDIRAALDGIDYYRTALIHEKTVQLLVDDRQAPYFAKYYENLLARLYAAFACYQLNEPDNAFAFLKQAMILEDLQIEENKQQARSPLLAYLLALHLEKKRDFSQAALFYRRAYEVCPRRFIERDWKRSQEQKEYAEATLLCVIHKGLIPEKESIIAPASVASAALVETLLPAANIPPAFSSLTGIALPAFVKQPSPSKPYSLIVNHQPYQAEKLEDIADLAKKDLDTEIPHLAAQAVARQLLRRTTIGIVKDKNALAGDLTDLFMFIANLATQADTRMWKTLPHDIYLLRIDVPPGTYSIGYGQQTPCRETLQCGQLRVLHFFHPL